MSDVSSGRPLLLPDESSGFPTIDVTSTAHLDELIERSYSLITPAYEYLFRCAAATGHWNETRSTALAGMATERVLPPHSPWLAAIRQHLLSTQSREGGGAGSWGEEIWDTAMAVLCLKSFGVSSRDPVIAKALEWVDSLYDLAGRHNWHDEPWETSWALISLLASGTTPKRVDLSATVDWLASLQDSSGRIIAPHYSAYFVLVAAELPRVRVADAARVSATAVSKRATDYLLGSSLQSSTLWAGEAWANGQILWAVARAAPLHQLPEPTLRTIVAWFEEKQETDGNWADVEDTASAILGLVALLEQMVEARDGAGPKVVEAELQRRTRVPRLYARLPLVELHRETGHVSIHLSRSWVRLISWIGILATAAATIFQLIDFAWNHNWLR